MPWRGFAGRRTNSQKPLMRQGLLSFLASQCDVGRARAAPHSAPRVRLETKESELLVPCRTGWGRESFFASAHESFEVVCSVGAEAKKDSRPPWLPRCAYCRRRCVRWCRWLGSAASKSGAPPFLLRRIAFNAWGFAVAAFVSIGNEILDPGGCDPAWVRHRSMSDRRKDSPARRCARRCLISDATLQRVTTCAAVRATQWCDLAIAPR